MSALLPGTKRAHDLTTDAAPPACALPGVGVRHALYQVYPHPGAEGLHVSLGSEPLLLGRDVQKPHLRVDDARTSRLHARVLWDARAAKYRLGDAQSRNGCFLNGQRVDSALLCPGDVIRVGDTLLVLVADSGEPSAQALSERLARSALGVLLHGETGTGKELLARRIHALSGRRGDFVPVNCAALPRELVAAELFGHTRGAFSGALTARAGVFEAARGGTLLLDEIGDFPLDVQAALLRVLQERKVRAVGADREQAVDVRVLAATHHDLARAVKEGRFRADLYARIAQTVITLPALRDRKHELLGLAHEIARAQDGTVALDANAAEALLCWHWPYNLRELDSLVRELHALRGKDGTLDIPYLREVHPQLVLACAETEGDRRHTAQRAIAGTPDRATLARMLEAHAGNVSELAKALNKPRAQVYRWMRALGLVAHGYRRARAAERSARI